MANLTPEIAQKIVSQYLKDGSATTYSRYITADYSWKKVGWSIKTNNSKITIITSKLYNTPPYQRDKKQLTIDTNKAGNTLKIIKWVKKIY